MDEPLPSLRKECWLGSPQGPVRTTFGILGCSSEETHVRVQGKLWRRIEDGHDSSVSSAALLRDQSLGHPLEPLAQETKGPTLSSPCCMARKVSFSLIFHM